MDDLRVLTAELLHVIMYAPIDPSHPFHQYEHPETWSDIQSALGKVVDWQVTKKYSRSGGKDLSGLARPTGWRILWHCN